MKSIVAKQNYWLSFFFVLLALHFAYPQVKFLSQALTSTGTIQKIGVDVSGGRVKREGFLAHVKYKYTDYHGFPRTKNSPPIWTFPYNEGDEIPIYYHENKLEYPIFGGFVTYWGTPIIFIGIGLVFSIIIIFTAADQSDGVLRWIVLSKTIAMYIVACIFIWLSFVYLQDDFTIKLQSLKQYRIQQLNILYEDDETLVFDLMYSYDGVKTIATRIDAKPLGELNDRDYFTTNRQKVKPNKNSKLIVIYMVDVLTYKNGKNRPRVSVTPAPFTTNRIKFTIYADEISHASKILPYSKRWKRIYKRQSALPDPRWSTKFMKAFGHKYKSASIFKAIAFAKNKNGKTNYGYSFGMKTQQEADDAALSTCQETVKKKRRKSVCRIFASGDDIVWWK